MFDKPIENALAEARSDRLWSMIYASLNPMKEFRREWKEFGSHYVVELLLNSARPNWSDYPGAFWIAPWIAQHLRSCDSGALFYIVERWLEKAPLPERINKDPSVEDKKVMDLKQLLGALNRGG